MFKRDSATWWVVMGAALLMGASSRMDLIDPFLPAQHTDKAHALIELVSYLVGVAAGVMRASPIHAISDEGRAQFIKDSRR